MQPLAAPSLKQEDGNAGNDFMTNNSNTNNSKSNTHEYMKGIYLFYM